MKTDDATIAPAIIVLAKSPVPGKVKTRCCPPCTPTQAAELATAALADTLRAVDASAASRVIIAIDGEVGAWLPARFEVQQQCSGSLGERIDHAFRTAGQAALLIGMDTPQVSAAMLDAARQTLQTVDAVVGPSVDGGFWALGQRLPDTDVCRDVPMSRDDTGVSLRAALARRGLTFVELNELADVDDFATALSVAQEVPDSSFAQTVTDIEAVTCPVGSLR